MLKFSNLRLDDLLAMFVASFVSKQEGAKKAKTSRGWRNCPIFTDDHIKNSVDRSIIGNNFFLFCLLRRFFLQSFSDRTDPIMHRIRMGLMCGF